ncbi:MAG: DNA polymerase III subunit gamma/tau [Verrucomicrobiota bacterium]|nr:DNA polymerase III subunit gamma/tau [Verrucomicrobiota bacterium]
MSYQVIARKYRPQRFADVVGQEHVTTTLSNAIASGRVAHAYLFAGPRGTGKTTIARIFAKCLNATDGPTVDFMDDDERCAEIAEGRSLDVLEIDGASNRGIDQIRELRDTVNYAPASSRHKVYIIDEVHMLTKEAFNALLKTLEEPPEHVKFMFATTEPEQVLVTILSRCQRFDLRRIPAALIVEHLTGIAKKEKVKIDEAALNSIARGADGGMRDAESTLDQLISFCGDKISEGDVLSMFGLAAQAQVLGLTESILNGESETALRQFNELASGGKELRRLVGDLLNHFRNLLVFMVSKSDVSLLEITESEKNALTEQAKLTDSGALGRILEVLTDCEMRLRDAASKKILVEVSLLKAIQAAGAMSLDEVLDKLQELRGGTDSTPTKIPAKKTASKSAAKPTKQVAVAEPVKQSAAPPAPTGSIEALWPDLVRVAGEVQPFAAGYINEAHPVSLEDNLLTIGFAPEYIDQMELADNPKFHQTLRQSMEKLGHRDIEVKFVQAERPVGWDGSPSLVEIEAPAGQEVAAPDESPKPKPQEGPLDMEEFKKDPLIQKAVEVFKGQIVDVRSS